MNRAITPSTSRKSLLGALLVAAAGALAPSTATAIVIQLTDPNADYFADGTDPCPRGGPNDDCWTVSNLSLTGTNEFNPIFQNAWNAWNNALPMNQRWTLASGQTLAGTLKVSKFDTYNNCPGTGGVEVRASFTPGNGDPASWTWIQGLHDNYETGNAPNHNGPPAAARFEMDINNGGPALPPAYPFQYADGHYYDKPGAFCIDDSDVFFRAVALMAKVDYTTRTCTVYEGFSYDFTVKCRTVPTPGALCLAGLGALLAVKRRNR